MSRSGLKAVGILWLILLGLGGYALIMYLWPIISMILFAVISIAFLSWGAYMNFK